MALFEGPLAKGASDRVTQPINATLILQQDE